jgi:charged multivesicular body protein 6
MGGYSSKYKEGPEQASNNHKNSTNNHNHNHNNKPKITSIDRTILDLKNTRDKLQQYRTRLLREDETLMTKVKQAKAQNKTSYALQLLKLHHYKQQQYEQCNTQLLNILQMVQTIDSTQNDIHIVAAMTAGKNSLQQLQSEISIDQIVTLLEDIQEQHDTEAEMAQVLQDHLPNLIISSGNSSIMDSDEVLLAELEALQQSDVATTTTTTTNAVVIEDQLPTVPTHKLPALVVPSNTTTTATASTKQQQQQPERIAVMG